ncbi:uncharacterized protein ACIQIH_012120 isoform 2-T2 [Cyanocitta cristata]
MKSALSRRKMMCSNDLDNPINCLGARAWPIRRKPQDFSTQMFRWTMRGLIANSQLELLWREDPGDEQTFNEMGFESFRNKGNVGCRAQEDLQYLEASPDIPQYRKYHEIWLLRQQNPSSGMV